MLGAFCLGSVTQLDQDFVVRIQVSSPPTIFNLASLCFGGNLSQLFFVNIPSIILRPHKYNNVTIKYGLYLELSSRKNGPIFQTRRSTTELIHLYIQNKKLINYFEEVDKYFKFFNRQWVKCLKINLLKNIEI